MFFLSDDPLFSDEELLLMCAASGGKTVEDTATGNPLTFTTDLARPLKSLLIPFTPQQEGSGDPSPTNIRSILPWNGLTVFGGGKSLFPFVKTEYEATSNYNGYDTETAIPDSFIGQKLTYSAYFDNTNSAEPSSVRIWGKDKNDSWIWLGSAGNEIGAGAKGTSYNTILIPQNVAWIGFGMNMKAGSKYSQPMVELGQTATAYEPYHQITETDIVFPDPVYGGTLDVVSGVLKVEWGAVRADSCEWEQYASNPYGQGFRTLGTTEVPFASWQSDDAYLLAKSNALKPAPYDGTFDGSPLNSFWWNNYRTGYRCIYTHNATVQDLMNFFTENNVIFCGKLAEPYEIQLTPAQITALVGDNTIWSDADGQLTAVYLKKG